MPEASPRRPLGHSPPSAGDGLPAGKRPRASDEAQFQLTFDSEMTTSPEETSPESSPVTSEEIRETPLNGKLPENLNGVADDSHPETVYPVKIFDSADEDDASEDFVSVHSDDADQTELGRVSLEIFKKIDSPSGEDVGTNSKNGKEAFTGAVTDEEESAKPPLTIEEKEDQPLIEASPERTERISLTREIANMMDDSLCVRSPDASGGKDEELDLKSAVEDATVVPDVVLEWCDMLVDYTDMKSLGQVHLSVLLNGVSFVHGDFTFCDFLLRFSTSDPAFLAHWSKKRQQELDKTAVFSYRSASLYGAIIADKCEVRIMAARKGIELTLFKARDAYWLTLYLNPVPPKTSSIEVPAQPAGSSKSGKQDEEDASEKKVPQQKSPDFAQKLDEQRKMLKKTEAFNALDRSFLTPKQNHPDESFLTRWTSHEELPMEDDFETGLESRRRPIYYGLTGLNNVGNSCYLGAVLQCLANTRELRDYFIDGLYEREVKAGRGQFAHAFDVTLSTLWEGNRAALSPNKMREAIARKNDTFAGYSQQDAQEALTVIIDSLHEDLNRVTVKPYLEEIACEGRPEEELARQTWDYLQSRDNSAIHDLFTGLFKSSLECPTCAKKSIKFDPYQILSVPVPKAGLVLDCYYFARSFFTGKSKCVRFRVKIDKDHTLGWHFPQFLGRLPGIESMEQTAVLLMKKWQLIDEVDGALDCRNLDESYQFILYEILTSPTEPIATFVISQRLRMSPEQALQTQPTPLTQCRKCFKRNVEGMRRCAQCYAVWYCSRECQHSDWNLHKDKCRSVIGDSLAVPFVISVKESQLNHKWFQIQLARAALLFVLCWRRPKTVEPAKTPAKSPADGEAEREPDGERDGDSGVGSSLSNCSTTSASSGTLNEPDVTPWNPKDSTAALMRSGVNSLPFYCLPVESFKQPWETTSRYAKAQNPEVLSAAIKRHTRFLMVWDNVTPKYRIHSLEHASLSCDDDEESCTHLETAEERRARGIEEKASLSDCVQLLTQPEILSTHDAWKCPVCKVPREASKKFEIWSLPTVLVFQLKRFTKPTGELWRRDKIDTMVEYPIRDLDMSRFLVGPGDGLPYIYDLYAVVKHRGSAWYGHYVAHARLYRVPETLEDEVGWRWCDDESVELNDDPEKIVDRGAYLLFYRRRNTPSPILLTSDGSSSPESPMIGGPLAVPRRQGRRADGAGWQQMAPMFGLDAAAYARSFVGSYCTLF